MYYIYMLRCEDNSIYTGITTNLEKRMAEHFEKQKGCAKYTYTHTATKIENCWRTENRKLASKLEYHIKKLPKQKKELLIQNNDLLESFLGEKIEANQYQTIEKNSL